MGNKPGTTSSSDIPIASTEDKCTQFLAWCSGRNNKIKVFDIKNMQNHVQFAGACVRNQGNTVWSYLKEIPNTKLLISLHNSAKEAAKLEVFDVSQRDQQKKIYSFEETTEGNGRGVLAYSAKRNLIGAISIRRKIAYHLFSIENDWQSNGIVKLLRKSKWPSCFSTEWDNYLSDLDFDPNGEFTATVDCCGKVLVSDVSSHRALCHRELVDIPRKASYGSCRWSTNISEPSLFVNYLGFNIIDLEKNVVALKNPNSVPIADAQTNPIMWMDVCQSNGNLVAFGGYNGDIRIYDRRKAKIAGAYSKIHSSN